MTSLPRIKAGLLRHPLDSQVLVYDPGADKVHLLDPTTAVVLELLEAGGWTREGMAIELKERLGVPPDSAMVSLALHQLRESGLLDEATLPSRLEDVTRRDLVRKLALTGAAALLVPAIATLTATSAYAAGTLGGIGASCTANGNCASNRCCTATGQCVETACGVKDTACSPIGVNCACCKEECKSANDCK